MKIRLTFKEETIDKKFKQVKFIKDLFKLSLKTAKHIVDTGECIIDRKEITYDTIKTIREFENNSIHVEILSNVREKINAEVKVDKISDFPIKCVVITKEEYQQLLKIKGLYFDLRGDISRLNENCINQYV